MVNLSSQIGDSQDGHEVQNVMGRLKQLIEHIHKPSKSAPSLDPGVTVTAAGGSWTYGAWVEVIAAGSVNEEIDVHFIDIAQASTVDEYQIQVGYGGAGSEIPSGCVSFARTTNQVRVASLPVQTELIPVGSRVAIRLASNDGSNNATAKIYYHEY